MGWARTVEPPPLSEPGGSGSGEMLGEVVLDLVDAHPLLAHVVALAARDRLVVEGLEVDRDAQRGADLVLTAVAAAYGTGVVEVDVPALAQTRSEVLGGRRELLVATQRKHGGLDRGQARIELEQNALVRAALRVRGLVLGVGLDEEGHHRTGQPEGGFDDVRGVALSAGLVEVLDRKSVV